MVSVTEVLVRPLQAGDASTRAILQLLRHFPNLGLREVDFDIAVEAAHLRARFQLLTSDALIVATALSTGLQQVVTNEVRWTRRLQPLKERLVVHYLESYLPLT